MDFNRSSCWNSISEKVKAHIPTIDFDFSSSEEDDTIAIYESPAALSLQVPEDSFSEEDAELEELLKPVPQTCSDHQTVESSILASEADLEPGAGEDKSEALDNRVKLEASLKPNLDIAKSYEGCPVLSFARLDQWDLDDVLRNLKETKLSLQQHVTVAPAKTHAGSDINQSQENIMEKLAAFCKKQSESVKSPDCIRENKMSSRLVEKRTADLQLSHQERPAVYIYSRCPDPSVKPAKTSPNLSSEPETPAQHNDNHQKNPPAKKNNLEVHTGSHMGGRGVTGKSMLLQKIRAVNRNVNKYAVKCTHRADLGVEANTEVESEHLWVDEQSDPEMENPQTDLESLVKEPKQHSGQQRWWFEKTFHREEAQKILRQLEGHRPTKSVDEKQPAAEMTCALYEFEAPHLESFNSPAAGTERKGSMLLKVSLSSPGVVGERGHGKRKHPAATRSHIYNTLVAWFLSLAGPEPRNCEDEVSAKVPFWVAGFQQLWTEDGLALHVLVVARHCYPARKRDKDIHAPFYSDVCRFLSETSLTVIARWLPELKNLLDQQPYTSPIHLPSSCLNCFISAISNQTVIERTFGLSPGLYWQTVKTQDRVFKGKETTQELHTGVSVVLGSSGFFQHPLITHYTLQLVLDSGLDVCGLRLLYPPQGLLTEHYGTPVYQKADEPCHPVVALAVRGPYAHSLLKDITTSLDSLLSKKANNTSSEHLRCRYQEPPFIHFPQLASQVHSELCLWFSGRLQGGSAQNHSGIVPSDDVVGSSPFKSSTSPSFLCATTKADFLLLVSPVVPPCCYVQVLAVCERRGFSFRGLQRLQLQSYGATLLGLTSYQTSVFCGPPASALDREELQLPSHCLVLLLRKENALRHSVNLPSALMREFKAQKLLGYIHSANDGVHTLEPSLCFHTVPYNNNLFQNFVKCMWAVPDPASVILSHHRCPSTPDMEQVVVLTLCGKDLTQGLSLLHRVLIAAEGDEQQAGFRLLSLKWLPALTRLQAQELSPYEVGDQLCYNSVETLMSSPALVCALRGFHVFSSLRKLLLDDSLQSLSILMSPTPEVALRQTSLFFFKHEMIPDPQTLLTVCLFRPRVWNHSLAKIVHKLQQSGLTLVGLRVVTLDKSDATSLLPAESVHNLCSGPSLALCLQGENAVKRLLDMLSQEDSLMWMTCYGSGSYQQAVMDVRRFFPEGICCPETSTMRQEQILSLCSDPFASMEHKQSCTLTHVTQESLSVSTASQPNGGFLIHRQTTCLLIPLNARPRSQVPSQLEIVDQVLRSDCHLVAGRMSILDDEQRRHIAKTLKVSSVREKKMAYFYLTPCLLMALQGENIVTGFSLILKRIYEERSDLEQVGKRIIYPESEKEATQLILYLFESLSSECCDAIVQ
ncbi:uncharacterized protein LOC115784880 isoform X2 [Archocentrus centrarchus]|uniref:uncharacterized protein LOC115784880 isoform X2 n=1 Tax=Archocentrus centrarchus TaxID=63155 RepID=UPI0011E9E18E|nr:uncharacterized protein C16orf71 homolog isoform X2 [Archocentrus centrarchus]